MLKSENSFVNLGLNSYIINVLKDIGYNKPLPIQTQCIPFLLKGYDVLGMANTGSGKTAAFVLPLLQNIDIKNSSVQGLIVTPTRELAIQIGQVCINFSKYMQKINIIVLYGGQNYNIQFRALKKNPHIIIGTPGRLLDHLNRGTADISTIKTLIIDEADEMLRMGFIEDIEHIIEKIPNDRQTALFSATLPMHIRRISYRFMRNPKEVYINSDTNVCSDIKQSYWLVNGIAKHEALIRFLETEDFDAAIVFVRTKSATLKISEILDRSGYNSAALNGDMDQTIRHQTVSQLRYGQLDILITTDVAARGLDIHRISLVINYDIPNNYDAYVHRIGRTGRAGRVGKSLLFVERQEYRLLHNIKRGTNFKISEVQYPTANTLITCRLTKFTDKVANQLHTNDIEIYRSLLTRIKPKQDLTIEKLAAVLLKIAQGNRPLVLPPDPIIQKQSIHLKKIYHTRKNHKRYQDHQQTHNNSSVCINKLQFDTNKNKTNVDIDLYRISVGRNDGVKIRHIIGAVSNKINVHCNNIGNVRLFSSYSIVEVSRKKITTYKNIPALSRIRILNKPVNIKFIGRIPANNDMNPNKLPI